MRPADRDRSPTHLDAIIAAIRSRFSLRDDRADDQQIDHDLRQGVTMRGTNLWVLMFAIFIASIGLNVNSPAVIIGAMLVSPLMGPIMGIGYGAGILDFALVRSGLRNLGIATAIALLASTAYWLITPLTGAQSELLARTTPTLWDVLIALFGGLAGIIGVTRKQKSNVIPGVAIATALMPPLCTAGYGLANGNWDFFFGALYLFTINGVFIGASAALITRAFHLERKQFDDPAVERRVTLMMATVVTATLLPSLYLAYRMVGDEIFRTRATQFVNDRLELENTHVSDIDIKPRERHIKVYLIGERLPDTRLNEILARMPGVGLPDAGLQVFQSGDERLDMTTLRSSLLADLYRDSQQQLAQKEDQISQLRAELQAAREARERIRDVAPELNALFPQVSRVLIADSPEWNIGTGAGSSSAVSVVVRAAQPLSPAQRERIVAWLQMRLHKDEVSLLVARE